MTDKLFVNQIIKWYKFHKRDLPWRDTTDPYKIWLSEIILQQTRVQQGLSYYLKFINEFEDVNELANAPEDKILRLWQGLGYYSRARNLHFTAKHISQQLNGVFPKDYKGLLKLKGVGEYTAAAIASFAYKEPVGVLDGNVFRVISRYFGIENDISIPASKKIFQSKVNNLVPKTTPDEFNQSIMEFGALQCTPKSPDCLECPLNNSCFAYKESKQDSLPVKSKKTKVKTRYLYYLVLHQKDHYYLKKRTSNDIWKGLYDFHCLESDSELSHDEVLAHLQNDKIINENSVIQFSRNYKHILSHRIILAQFIQIKNPNHIPDHLQGYTSDEIESLGKPILIDNFLKESNF